MIVIIVKSGGRFVSGVFVNIKLKMLSRNDYDVIGGPSGVDGSIHCSRTYISNWCDEELRIFQSDYRSIANGFANEIHVNALAGGDLDRALAGVKRFGGVINFPREYERDLRRSKKLVDRLRGQTVTVEVIASPDASSLTITSRDITA